MTAPPSETSQGGDAEIAIVDRTDVEQGAQEIASHERAYDARGQFSGIPLRQLLQISIKK